MEPVLGGWELARREGPAIGGTRALCMEGSVYGGWHQKSWTKKVLEQKGAL